MQLQRRNARGDAVADIRRMLAGLGLLGNTDPHRTDLFDEPTELAVRHFQQQRGLNVDGIVGPETYGALVSAHWRLGDRVLAHEAGQSLVGDDVLALQTQLMEMGYAVHRTDGWFGPLTASALRSFQRDYGLRADGVCGPATLHALRQLGRRVTGGRPQLLREELAVASAGPSLLGKRIVIDPGHGGEDAGGRYEDHTEAGLTWDLATRLEGRLSALGITTWMTRGPNNGASDDQRAQFANEVDADLVISLHVDTFASPRAHGIATYYFGGTETSSTVGERLAGLVQRELVARTGLLDARSHAKAWALLRLTRMPAVRVDVGYLSSPIDRGYLLDPVFRDTVAEGLLVAVQRLYLAPEDDAPTGQLVMPAHV